jgi:hypothetical protein
MEVVATTFWRTSESRQVHSLLGAQPFGWAPFFSLFSAARRICSAFTLWPKCEKYVVLSPLFRCRRPSRHRDTP